MSSDAAPGEVVLYHYFRSSSAWRVRIALNLKQIPHRLVAVSLLKKEQHEAEFVKLNPSRAVPTLLIDDHVLAQSAAILEYLEETRPEPALLPKDAFLRQQVRQIVAIVVSDTQPVQNLRVLQMVGQIAGDAQKEEWARHWIDWNFKALEQVLARTAGKYCVGDDITMADAVLVPQVYNAHRYKVDMAQFPTIVRINATLSDLPEFRKAHAHMQDDCPPELKQAL